MKSIWIAVLAIPLSTACFEDATSSARYDYDLNQLQEQITALENRLAATQAELASQIAASRQVAEGFNVALDRRIAAEERVTAEFLPVLAGQVDEHDLKLQRVRVEEIDGKPAIVFQGANLHVRNTAGTEGADGTGNLIFGPNAVASGTSVNRIGSYNLVLGPRNAYASTYSVVIGAEHQVTGSRSLVTGLGNTTAATGAVVFGERNTLLDTATFGSILGGHGHQVASRSATIVGGNSNAISTNSDGAVIGGGRLNRIADNYDDATIGGGVERVAPFPGSFTP